MAAQWWEKEAQLLQKRIRSRSADRPILFETGYGPSGLPHLGTFAEVARTSFVRWAFQRMFPDLDSRLLAFSDDMDGLRSVPENIPGRESLVEHLGKPLSRIPDPYGEAESFSAHMIGRLKRFLTEFGFECDFMASSECYGSGRFDAGLLELLRAEEKVKSIVLPTLKPETRKTWSPFLPICESCGRYTTRVTETQPDEGTLSYSCELPFGGAQGCGHQGTLAVTGGEVKVGWKVDWALRWMMLGVDYEMFGKDLIESADISRKICRAMGYPAPVGSFYELFLDEEGHKISKKIGNGIGLDEWREYAPDDSILYLLTKAPRKARRIGRQSVGRTTDEFLRVLRNPEPHTEMVEMIASSAPAIERTHGWKMGSELDFSVLVSLIGALGIDEPSAVESFLLSSPALRVEEQDRAFLSQLVAMATRYFSQVVKPQQQPASECVLTDTQRQAVKDLKEQVEASEFDDGDALQSLTYAVGKSHELELKEWFSLLYRVLTGNSKGPRLGTLMLLLGRERSLDKLNAVSS